MTPIPTPATAPRPHAGRAAFLLGAVALLLVLVQTFAGPFAPQQDVGTSLGQIAADLRAAALGEGRGAPRPAPAPLPWDIDRGLAAGAAALAGLAVIAALAGLVRHEARPPATAGLVLGVAAILLQTLVWAVALVAGALVLAALVHAVLGGGDPLG